MLTHIKVRNFQSLRSVDLELGRLTVIVGASSSGKTALVRALRALTANLRGAASITRGAAELSIAASTAEKQITLRRTASNGQYEITNLDGTDIQQYTKLAGTVPEAVTALLRIHIAGQFDPPYLLDAAGSAVARELGELTNVTAIFNAVREANRRRTAYAGTLKARETDLAALQARLHAFADHPAKLTACTWAEEHLHRADDLENRSSRLQQALDRLTVAETALACLPQQTRMAVDLARVEHAKARLDRYIQLARHMHEANTAATRHEQDAQQHQQRVDACNDQIHTALVEAGTCPTCDQPTRQLAKEASPV